MLSPPIAGVRVNLREFVGCKGAILQCANGILDLHPAAGAHQRTGDRGVLQHPGNRHLREALTTLLRDVISARTLARFRGVSMEVRNDPS